MTRLKSFAAAAALAALALPAPAHAQSKPPKLLVVISVDQLSGDLFDAYRPTFTGGLARLATQGTVFRNGYQSHAATETCPGHSTILTAWHPARNGIVANLWVDQSATRADKNIYCAEDESVAGSTSTAYTVSPAHLRAQTLGDLMKRANPASRNVAVAGKDRAAVMMGGRNVDQRWYWEGSSFSTDLKTAPVLPSVTAFKAAFATALAQPRAALVPPANCAGKGKEYTLAPGLTVGNGRFERKAGDSRAFRLSPDFDGAVLALSAALIGDMRLGKGKATDLISIGLSATDYVGHAYGNGGMEMCLQMASLDHELGRFFQLLDRSGIDYAVALTADHGADDIPERLRDMGIAGAARVDRELSVAKMGQTLAGRFGLTGTVLHGGLSDMWLDTRLSAVDRGKSQAAAVALAKGHPQVHSVYTKAQIAALPVPSGDPRGWSVEQRLRASFDPQRSGDILVVLKEHITPIAVPSAGYAATHGSPWDYDRRVPIILWRKGAAKSERNDWADTVDLMPTLAGMIGLKLAPGSTDGRCIDHAAGTICARR